MPEPKVSIIIVNWNNLKDTAECLGSVNKISYANHEIIVVDNGSTDGSPEEIERLFPDIILLRNGENLGYAEGNNAGITAALKNGADYILLLNNDTIVDPLIVRAFVEAAGTHPDSGIFGPKIYYHSDPNRIWYAGARTDKSGWPIHHVGYGERDDNVRFNKIEEAAYVCGAVFFVRKDVLLKTGLFDPVFFLTFEEVDLCYRAKRDGFSCLFVPEAKAWHKISASFKGRNLELAYFFTRNQLLFAKRHLALRRPRLYVNMPAKMLFPAAFADPAPPPLKRIYRPMIAIFKNPFLFAAKVIGIMDFYSGRFGRLPPVITRLERTKKSLRGMLDSIKFCVVNRGKYFNTWRYRIKDIFFPRYIPAEARDLSGRKVSIIIPTLARAEQADHFPKLRKLLSKHLPGQSHKNYEAIVYCDGRNKKVEEMTSSLHDERIKVYSTDCTLWKWGHPQTRMAIEKASGDFFVRMNDDNVPHGNYLRYLLSGFGESVGIVYGRVIYRGSARREHELTGSFIIPRDREGRLESRNIDCMCYMVRMDLAKRYAKYWNDEFGADFFFIEALLKDKVQAKFLDTVIGDKF